MPSTRFRDMEALHHRDRLGPFMQARRDPGNQISPSWLAWLSDPEILIIVQCLGGWCGLA